MARDKRGPFKLTQGCGYAKLFYAALYLAVSLLFRLIRLMRAQSQILQRLAKTSS